MRRAVHENFNARAVEQYRTTQREATVLALLRILQSPSAWEENLQTYVLDSMMTTDLCGGRLLPCRINASAICNSVYGWPPFEPGAPLMKHMQDFIAYGSKAALPGAHLVDIFPIMKYIPASMARWKRKAMKWHEDQDKVFKGFRVDAVDKTVSKCMEICVSCHTDLHHGIYTARGRVATELCFSDHLGREQTWPFRKGAHLAAWYAIVSVLNGHAVGRQIISLLTICLV